MFLENPETFFLSSIYWQLFGGLTFRQADLSERSRLCMWFSFVREIARFNRLHLGNVLWVLRLERGDLAGRLHFHFLVLLKLCCQAGWLTKPIVHLTEED